MRRYTEEERARALAHLAANAGNRARTARQLGIDRITLKGWAGEIPPGTSERPTARQPARTDPVAVDRAMSDVAADLERGARIGARRIADAMASVPLETAADLRNASVAVAVNIDKRQLLTGAATSRSVSLHALVLEARHLAEADTVRIPAGEASRPALPALTSTVTRVTDTA